MSEPRLEDLVRNQGVYQQAETLARFIILVLIFFHLLYYLLKQIIGFIFHVNWNIYQSADRKTGEYVYVQEISDIN